MKPIKTADLRDKSVEELEEMANSERVALYQTRRDLVFRKVSDRASLKIRRHNLARLLTVIGEKKRGKK